LIVEAQSGQKFLLDVNGTYLPYSPKVGYDVIVASGAISYSYLKKEIATLENVVLCDLFTVATLIKKDPFYEGLFKQLVLNDKHEIILHSPYDNLPVLFGSAKDAEKKFETLKYMYKEVIPYVNENKYARLDVRFTNRIIASIKRS
jgi:hypothetical protein